MIKVMLHVYQGILPSLYRPHYDICTFVDGNDLSLRERKKDTYPEYI